LGFVVGWLLRLGCSRYCYTLKHRQTLVLVLALSSLGSYKQSPRPCRSLATHILYRLSIQPIVASPTSIYFLAFTMTQDT
jgi:hypothetical protein